MKHRRLRATLAAASVAIAALAGMPPLASAHPLGNFTVNRAILIEIGAGVRLTAVLDLAEIPAFEAIREIDTDGDDRLTAAEGDPYASISCASWSTDLLVSINGEPAPLEASAEPELSLPTGVGGLPTIRLVCRFDVADPAELVTEVHELRVRDGTVDKRIGWREVTAVASGTAAILSADVPETSPSALLSGYPDAELGSSPDVREATVTFRLSSAAGGATTSPPPGEVVGRDGGVDPLTGLVAGALSPGVVALAVLLSLGLGAAHALSPGHGKTLVAAYVLGAGGSARSAIQIGLWVAISHTAGVLVLGAFTLLASEILLPEHLIAWLSLGSGIVVTGLGFVLLGRVLIARRAGHAIDHHHDRGHDDGHDHDHDHDHGHDHPVPAAGELSWRSAIALGFAGGAVPSASALIVLLVAVGTDRLLLGIGLIGCFGIGMAAVLGGLALLTSRLREVVTRRGTLATRAPVRLAVRLAPIVAGVVVLVTGVAFTAAAIGQLA
jgi:ABC-type nickel/cobalt efflux system permease component RcnA